MFKRIILFLVLNFVIMMTISFITSALGVGHYLTPYGLDYQSLAIFCLIWGMGGSFISLLMSKQMAKWMMGVQIIDANTRDSRLADLVQTVHNLARSAGLSKMPEVGIYESHDVNAFATGPSKNNSLVAVSTGLLSRMKSSEIEGVLGHEIAHVANGDMVTMTLLQGVVNAFVMFIARIVAFAVANAGRSRDDENRGGGFNHMTYYITQFVVEIVLMIIGSMIVAWFSRYREFRADAGGARLAGRDKMIGALEALKRVYDPQGSDTAAPAFQSMQISGRGSGLLRLFASHPALDQRIARLETMTNI